MAILYVNNTAVKTPSVMSFGIYDVSAPDSGRDINGLMYKNTIGQKRTIELEWWNPSAADTATLLTLFQSNEYFKVKYYDPTNASTMTEKTFYLGDRTAPVKQWTTKDKRYEKVSFSIIER